MKSRERDGERRALIAAVTASHRRLEQGIVDLTDVQARQGTRLEGWTVGHVLTHLARNADGVVRMFDGAERGEVVSQYETGVVSRQADIDAGARRGATELVADVIASAARLEATWAAASPAAWAGRGLTIRGECAIEEMPYRRMFETELHHVDLGRIGDHEYTFADLPPDFVGRETRRLTAMWASRRPMGLTALPAAALGLAPHDRLAWLTGRREVDGLDPAGVLG